MLLILELDSIFGGEKTNVLTKKRKHDPSLYSGKKRPFIITENILFIIKIQKCVRITVLFGADQDNTVRYGVKFGPITLVLN